MLPPLRAGGERVEVATVTADDLAPYRQAVHASSARLAEWNPVDPEDLGRHLSAQSTAHRTFVIRARDAEGSHGIVGKVNVTNVVRGRFQSGAIGYDAYDPYVGRGLFAEGLRLVVDLAFAREPDGMGLHRVEANVQPRNVTSAGVLRKLGFRREGHIPHMLWLADASGRIAWRDHDSYAMTAGEWPAQPYGRHRPTRSVVLINGCPGAARTGVARALSRELAVPLLDGDALQETRGGAGHRAVWALLADSPAGGVVNATFEPAEVERVATGLDRAGVAVDALLQVWCDDRTAPEGATQPVELPHTVRVDTTSPVPPRTVAALALQARAVAGA